MNIRPYLIRFFSSLMAGGIILIIIYGVLTIVTIPLNSLCFSQYFQFLSTGLLRGIKNISFSNFEYVFLLLSIFIGDMFSSLFEFLVAVRFFRAKDDCFERVYNSGFWMALPRNIASSTLAKTLYFIFYFFPILFLCILHPKKRSEYILEEDFSNCIRIFYNSHFASSEVFFNFHRFWGGITLSLLISLYTLSIKLLLNISISSIQTTASQLAILFIFYLAYNCSFYLTIKYRECGNEHLYYSTFAGDERNLPKTHRFAIGRIKGD